MMQIRKICNLDRQKKVGNSYKTTLTAESLNIKLTYIGESQLFARDLRYSVHHKGWDITQMKGAKLPLWHRSEQEYLDHGKTELPN